jgi:hypothetical protein
MARLLNIGLCLEDHHGCILDEVHATPIALPSMILHVLTRRADISQGRVAAPAELRCVEVLLAAFGALHGPL